MQIINSTFANFVANISVIECTKSPTVEGEWWDVTYDQVPSPSKKNAYLLFRAGRQVFSVVNVMRISEHLHIALRYNIKISNIRINLILLMQTVILGY